MQPSIYSKDIDTSPYSFSTQSVPLSGVVNARELGGYVLPDGRRIRRGLLLRGGSLARLTEEECRRIADTYHPTYVFDFRTEGEVKQAPDKQIPGSTNVWLPTIDPETEKLGTSTLPKEAYSNLPPFLLRYACEPKVQDVARRMYSDMVVNEYTKLQYAAFLQMIAAVDEGAIYWHCSQGKDRTGLGAAFVLTALGADRELVLKDFAISNEYYRDDVEDLKQILSEKGFGPAEHAVIQTFIGVNTDYFIQALDLIDSEYGSLDDYVRNQLMLTDEDRERLRSRFLE